MGVAQALNILGKIGGLAKKGGPFAAHRIAKEAMGSSKLGIVRPLAYTGAWGLGGTASILRGSSGVQLRNTLTKLQHMLVWLWELLEAYGDLCRAYV
jgi:hypothetical protein